MLKSPVPYARQRLCIAVREDDGKNADVDPTKI
jgi:hypothetical protein